MILSDLASRNLGEWCGLGWVVVVMLVVVIVVKSEKGIGAALIMFRVSIQHISTHNHFKGILLCHC